MTTKNVHGPEPEGVPEHTEEAVDSAESRALADAAFAFATQTSREQLRREGLSCLAIRPDAPGAADAPEADFAPTSQAGPRNPHPALIWDGLRYRHCHCGKKLHGGSYVFR